MPTDQEILNRLAPVFQDVFDDDDLVPQAEMTAADVEDWDSISHIRLVIAIEQELGVKFTTAELTSLTKVGDLVETIQRKLA